MLARRSKLVRDGWECDLPLLIPAFSSKGSHYRVLKNGKLALDVAGDLRDFGLQPAKIVLISAYDLHHRHLDLRIERSVYHAITSLKNAELVYVDSGGYELNEQYDSTEPKPATLPEHKPFVEDDYLAVLSKLDKDPSMPYLIVTNFDHAGFGKTMKRQIESAKRLFARFPRHLSSFIIKPERRSKPEVETEHLTADQLGALRSFHVVGVAADDLGVDLPVRLKRIATLRRNLDRAGVTAPLHIWGGLDPLVTPLYYFVGAELFDGLSWLRFAYVSGVATSRAGYQVLEPTIGVGEDSGFVRARMTLANRSAMNNLRLAMQQWRDQGGTDFEMFEPGAREVLRQAYSRMRSMIPELQEVH